MINDSPYTIPGVSDGGAHTKFFTGGAWTTDFCGGWCATSGKVTLEEAHYRLSALPAHAAGFRDRGVLREGAAADVVVYDMESSTSTRAGSARSSHDLPGGEWRRVQRATGYKAIIVNGEVTFGTTAVHRRHAGQAAPPRSRLTVASVKTAQRKARKPARHTGVRPKSTRVDFGLHQQRRASRAGRRRRRGRSGCASGA